ncbi:VOC family protein [Streptomyces sp. NPDC058142]|uniref:VOC family protein n=1 Tax=Streptomyces sp. NPDC058142 TaxID=3346355 RepID=UPI0036E8436A
MSTAAPPFQAAVRPPETGVNIQLVTRDATSSEESVVSVLMDDVDSACAEAPELGFEIVRPLTTEAWGVRRFLVRAPHGNVVNIVNHRERSSYPGRGARLTGRGASAAPRPRHCTGP